MKSEALLSSSHRFQGNKHQIGPLEKNALEMEGIAIKSTAIENNGRPLTPHLHGAIKRKAMSPNFSY